MSAPLATCTILRPEGARRHVGVTEVLTEDFSGGHRSLQALPEREGGRGDRKHPF